MRAIRLAPFFLLLCLAVPAGAANYYLAPDGNDAHPGSREKPWKTVAKAAAAIAPGDVVTLRGGIYRAATLQFGPAGKDEKTRTIYRAAKGERVIFTREDGTPPQTGLADYVSLEGLWIGGRWVKEEKTPGFTVGGSPVGRGKQLVNCTIFGYASGILVGSSEYLTVQGCRIVRCGLGRFSHGMYLSGGYTKGAMTQHVIVDDNAFVSGEGYAIHGWHNPHSCIITRNFVSGYYWDMVMSGSDHLVAHNTLWRNSGQPGREAGWNAWLPAERVHCYNNAMNGKITLMSNPGKESAVSHNAFLTAAPQASDVKPFDLRATAIPADRRAALDKWVGSIDKAVAEIDAAFSEPVEKLFANAQVEIAFAILKSRPPQASGLCAAGKQFGLVKPGAAADVGRTVTLVPDPWAVFDKLGLKHYDRFGNVVEPPAR